jgi:hypothetical protein
MPLPIGDVACDCGLQLISFARFKIDAHATVHLGCRYCTGRLSYIDISHNTLTRVPKITSSNIRVLRIHHNWITNLPSSPAGFFSGMPRVQSIQLHHNRITEVGLGTFAGLNYLENLELHSNAIVRFAPMTPPALLANGGPLYTAKLLRRISR